MSLHAASHEHHERISQPAAPGNASPTLAANPFVPGMGIAPAHLADREREAAELLAGLGRLPLSRLMWLDPIPPKRASRL